MGTKTQPQIHMEDKIITNKELEKLLEERQEAKAKASEYRAIDKKTKDKINSLAESPPYRIGRFIITRQATEGRSVSFETQPGSRLSIKTIEE